MAVTLVNLCMRKWMLCSCYRDKHCCWAIPVINYREFNPPEVICSHLSGFSPMTTATRLESNETGRNHCLLYLSLSFLIRLCKTWRFLQHQKHLVCKWGIAHVRRLCFGFQNLGSAALDPMVLSQQQFANKYPVPEPTKGQTCFTRDISIFYSPTTLLKNVC